MRIGPEPMPTSSGRCRACAACASAGSRAGIPEDARWDGVGELWFDSVEAALKAFATEPFASMLVEDRKKFMGEAQSCFVEEKTVIAPPQGR